MIQCFQVFFEFPESCFIMSSFDQKILRQILHTTMMIYMYQCFLDYFITDSYIPSYLIGDACIFYLVFSEKIRCYFSFFRKYDFRVFLSSNCFESFIFPIQNYWNICFDDSSFFRCDLLETISEELHMVVSYARDH